MLEFVLQSYFVLLEFSDLKQASTDKSVHLTKGNNHVI